VWFIFPLKEEVFSHNLDKMMKKGSMLIVKKVLGVLIGIAGIGLLLLPTFMSNLLCGNKTVFAVILIVASYFLVITGRQR